MVHGDKELCEGWAGRTPVRAAVGGALCACCLKSGRSDDSLRSDYFQGVIL